LFSRYIYQVNKILLFFLAVFLQGSILYDNAEAQGSGMFPVIERLDTRDTVFRQYLADVETARRLISNRNQDRQEIPGFLRIYSYTPQPDEDIFRLAARCNIPYATLASLNRINHPDMLAGTVLLPSMPGLFIPETPANDIERLYTASREMEGGTAITIRNSGRSERFLFFPGADFSHTERAFFLNQGFRFPLRTYRITSSFGMRADPFSGHPHFHQGVDLAAPLGTEVYPARAGQVVETGFDRVLGNYIIIAHDNNWVSLYGHLSSVSTSLHSNVSINSIIGRVGSTGLSTGPHLHFEIRRNGTAVDPTRVLFSF